jgi:DNA recombination protein RmuC
MEFIPNLAFFILGILITAAGALLVCRKLINAASQTAAAKGEAERSTVLAQLEAAKKRNAEISSAVSERERRIEHLVEERAEEIARRSAAEEQTKRIPVLESQMAETRERLDATSIRLVELEKQKSELTTTLEKDREALVEKVQLVDDAKKQLSGMFAEVSAVALQSNNQQFMDLAKQTLEGFQKGARADLEQRQKTIADLVSPVKLSLDKVDLKIQEMEIARAGAYEGLKQQVMTLAVTEQGLRTETSNLVKALRSPKVRGVWGEMQLRRVIELAGMLEHCDFVEQDSIATEQGLLRPDVLIRMPGGKTVVVDSKAPLEAYLEAIALDDDIARNLKLKDHARQVRNHITALGKKSYSDAFQTTPDYVVLFVPGEAFYTAAIDQDPALIEYGLEKGVVLAAPTTLIALLKAVAYGWKEESLKENALKISELGRDLYARLVKMGGHVAKLGRALGNAVESYNGTVGSLENRVLVTARKFKDLSVTNCNAAAIEQLEPIERVPRLLQAPEFHRRRNRH